MTAFRPAFFSDATEGTVTVPGLYAAFGATCSMNSPLEAFHSENSSQSVACFLPFSERMSSMSADSPSRKRIPISAQLSSMKRWAVMS